MPKTSPPEYLPVEILARPEIIDACGAWDVGRLFRVAQNLTDGAFSDSHLARRCGLTPSRVAEYAQNKVRAQRVSVISRVADGLQIPGHLFGIPRRPWETEPLVSISSQREVRLSGGLDMRALENLRKGLHETLSEGALDEYTLDDWERSATRYGEETRDRAPGIMISDLSSDLEALRLLLADCRTTSARIRLTRVIAQLSGLMVLSLVKLDQRDAFRQWARTARFAGNEAGDPSTHSWVLMQEAYGHFYSGDMREAVSVARRAQEVTTRPCVGSALAAALEARAHAALGRPEETRRALGAAEDALGALDPTELICSAFGYGEGSFRFHAGNAYTHLRDTSAAGAEHDRALQLIPATDYTDRAMVLLDQAQCLIHEGDAGGGASRAVTALSELTDDQRRGIIAGTARGMMQALPAGERDRPEVRDLEDLLAD